MTEPKLKCCPFCGGEAVFESVDRGYNDVWTVGCGNQSEDCIATQMISTFSRKADAAEAWNKRSPETDLPTLHRIPK
jgi:hypothetical protein